MNWIWQWHIHKVALRPLFPVELEFGVLVSVEGGKRENPEKNPRSNDENQEQTQPSCDARSGNITRATAVQGRSEGRSWGARDSPL